MTTTYYRNTVIIISLQGVEIEIGFLWKREADLMTLVDQNSYKPCFRILIIAQAVQILKCMHDRILNRVSTIRIIA